MKAILLIVTFLGLVTYCQAHPAITLPDGRNAKFHTILVEEVLQTSNYTYLHGKENDSERWLAVPSMVAKVGETYYYNGGLPMEKFTSKELNRTFPMVLFLGGVSSEPLDKPQKKADETADSKHHGGAEVYKRTATPEVKKDIKIESSKDCITVAELFAKKDEYAGKTIKIKGQVTKYNEAIMYKNWIHLQDGTDDKGKFDLIITSPSKVKVGDIVTLEGIVSLNKDFGYGYSFDVMIENAIVK